MNVEYKIIGNTIPFSKSIELYKRSAYIGPTDDGWSEIVKVDEQYYVVQQGLPEYEGHVYMIPVEIIIESSVQIIEEKDPYKMIELAGRTCYKSENNITEDSAKEFVDRMIKLGHGAMLEHGTIYLTIAKTAMNIGDPIFYVRNKYSKVNEDDYFYYITTNMRVIVENNRLDDLQYQVEPTEHHEIRITAKFIW